MLAKGCTIDVILPGKKGAKGFDLRLAQTRQFANFQNPIALQLFGSSLVLCVPMSASSQSRYQTVLSALKSLWLQICVLSLIMDVGQISSCYNHI